MTKILVVGYGSIGRRHLIKKASKLMKSVNV